MKNLLGACLATVLATALFFPTMSGHAAQGGKSLTLGGAVVVKPKYEGSDEHDIYGIPLIVPKFSDPSDQNPSTFKKIRRRVKIRGLDDVRLRLLENPAFEAGAVMGYVTDRDESDGRLLRGLGNIDGGLVLGGYFGLRYGDVLLDAALIDKVTGDDAGFQVRLGAETEKQISSRTKLTGRVGTTIASDDYMQTYFGVTPAQAGTSVAELPVFSPDGGIKDVYVELGTEVVLGDRWLFKAGGRYGRLLGDAADSPVVETENQYSGTLGLGYRFNFLN